MTLDKPKPAILWIARVADTDHPVPQLAEELRRRGYAVRVVGWADTDGGATPYLRRVRVGRSADPRQEPRSISIPTLRFFRDLLASPEPVIVHRDLGPVAAIVGLVRARRRALRSVALLEHDLAKAGPAATIWWKRLPRRLCAKAPTVVLANHHDAATQSQRLGVNPARIDTGWWMAGLDQQPTGGHDPIDSSAVRIVSVGKLIPRKGNDLLIRALATAVERGADLRLTIVGDGPERVNLQRLAASLAVADHVEFVGLVDHDDLVSVFDSADVAILASLEDHTGRSAIEAMSTGLPVLASVHSGIADILVNDDVNGRTFDPTDALGFVDLLVSLSPDRIARWAAGATATASERLGTETCADAVEQAVQHAIGEAEARR